MKIPVFDISGKKAKEIEAPRFFSEKVREDLIAKAIETRKRAQPYGPEVGAGNKYSARGMLKHHRHVWKSQYGRGMSRVPRKQMSRKGSQFNWVGAGVPNTRGGTRAHPPRVEHFLKLKKLNKRELKFAFISALSASADKKWVLKRYDSIEDIKISMPLLIESAVLKSKTKELIEIFRKILGDDLFSVSIIKKSKRAGKGKLRGRKYRRNSGLLIVHGEKEKIKTNAFETAIAKNLCIENLAKGGLGRVIVYTEDAIKEIENRLNENKSKEKLK